MIDYLTKNDSFRLKTFYVFTTFLFCKVAQYNLIDYFTKNYSFRLKTFSIFTTFLFCKVAQYNLFVRMFAPLMIKWSGQGDGKYPIYLYFEYPVHMCCMQEIFDTIFILHFIYSYSSNSLSFLIRCHSKFLNFPYSLPLLFRF